MLGKSGLRIRIQQDKGYRNDQFFLLGFEKVLKMQASVRINGNRQQSNCQSTSPITKLKMFYINIKFEVSNLK